MKQFDLNDRCVYDKPITEQAHAPWKDLGIKVNTNLDIFASVC